MRLYELTQIIEKINGNVFNRWSFFLIVILAILGWLIPKKEKIRRNESLILIIGLILGFACNGFGIHKGVKTIQTLEQERKVFVKRNDMYNVGNGKIYTHNFHRYLKGKSKYSAVIKEWYLLYIPLCVVTTVRS